MKWNEHDALELTNEETAALVGLERFADIVYAALSEVGMSDVMAPAFRHDDGSFYLEFDTDDYPEGSPEFDALCRAEELGQQAMNQTMKVMT